MRINFQKYTIPKVFTKNNKKWIYDDIRKMDDEKFNSIVFEEYDEQFMYFLGIALFFFVVEILIGDRRSRKHLFEH